LQLLVVVKNPKPEIMPVGITDFFDFSGSTDYVSRFTSHASGNYRKLRGSSGNGSTASITLL